MGNFLRVCIAVILILSIFTVSVFATPTGTYDMYSFDGRTIVGSSGSGNAYIGNFTRSLAYIHSIINNISTTIDYYLPAMNNNLHYIHVALVDAFSPGAGDTRNMWTLMSQAVSGINAISSTALGIAQDVYNISTYVDGVEGSLTSIGSKLDTVNVNLQNLKNIKWTNFSSYDISYSIDNITYYNSLLDLDYSNDLYVKINGINIDNSLFNFRIPIYTNLNLNNREIILSDISCNGYPIFKYNYYIFQNLGNIQLLIDPFSFYYNSNNYNFIFHFYSDQLIRYSTSYQFICSYISYNSIDYYYVSDFIKSLNDNDSSNLEDIKNILIDIDNNSDFIQNNNDLQINVDIDAADGQGITAIILKLQDLFDFGVGLQEFLVTLNEFDNLHWFTRLETYEQVNYDPRTNLGYQDLYD